MMSEWHRDRFFPDGRWSAAAWLEYWQEQWTVRPGYRARVLDGLHRMATLADVLRQRLAALSPSFGPDPWAQARQDAESIANVLRSVWIPLAQAQGTNMATKIVISDPLLTRPDAPLMQLGVLMGQVEHARPLREWGEIVDQEILRPAGRALRPAVSVLQIAALVGAGYVLLRVFAAGE